MHTFEEFNIILEPRDQNSGSILRDWSVDCLANFRHLFMKHRLVIIPVSLSVA